MSKLLQKKSKICMMLKTAEETETLEKDDHSEPGDAVVERGINVEQAGRSLVR